MNVKQPVVLKGNRDGIAVVLDKNIPFEILCGHLREKVSGAKQFFEGALTAVAFKGRALTDDEKRKMLDIIYEETTLEVSGVSDENFVSAVEVEAAEALLQETANDERAEPEKNEEPISDQNVVFHHGGLRSGQSIRHSGSVVLVGDANPGSEIIAGGNVVVLGALKGMAHAGSGGDCKAFISALVLSPTQMRIAHLFIELPPEPKGPGRKPVKKPSYAYIQDGQVFIAPLLNN